MHLTRRDLHHRQRQGELQQCQSADLLASASLQSWAWLQAGLLQLRAGDGAKLAGTAPTAASQLAFHDGQGMAAPDSGMPQQPCSRLESLV